MKNNLKKIFLIPFILVLICLFISFLEYKQITHINVYDIRLMENTPICGTFKELKMNSLHQCKNFFEFMTNRPMPMDLVITITIFIFSSVLSLFYFLYNKSKKLFFKSFFIFMAVFLILFIIYKNIDDKDVFFLTGKFN